MLSYKQWKSLNESILPSFNLGVANPTNMGLQSLFQTLDEAKKKAKKKMAEEDDAETGDGEVVEPSSEKDEPKDDMDVDVKEGEDDDKGCDKCGRMSKKKSKKKCGADMNPLEGDGYDEEEEDKEEEMPEEDEDEEEDEEEEDSEDEDSEDEDSEDEEKGMSKMMSKKKMSKDGELSPAQEELDKNHNGVLDRQDFKMMGKKKNSKKKMKESTEEEAWWNSVRNMIGPVDQKFDDGCNDGFQMIRTKQ